MPQIIIASDRQKAIPIDRIVAWTGANGQIVMAMEVKAATRQATPRIIVLRSKTVRDSRDYLYESTARHGGLSPSTGA